MASINGRNEEEEELVNQIELEMRKIFLSVEKLYNNQPLFETNDPIEKCLIDNYCYSFNLLEKGINGTVRNGDSLKKFEESLQEELNFLMDDLGKVVKKMNEHNELINSLDKNMSNLNAMLETAKAETTSNRKLDVITKHIKMRFKKEKADLKAIISSLFADNYDIQDLIARIIEHHFAEGTDKYLQLEVTDDITEQIELLRRTNLFDINPHDILQIRLADLVD